MIKILVSNGTKVHKGYISTGKHFPSGEPYSYLKAVCGADGQGGGYKRGHDLGTRETTQEVTCKKCLKMMEYATV